MKQAVIGILEVVAVIIFLLLLLNINGRSERQTEVDQRLESALEESLSSIVEENDLPLDFDKKLVASFVESLATGTKTDSTYIVNVLNADAKKKTMTIEVIERYRNEQGKISTASAVRTILYDRKAVIVTPQIESRFYLSEEDMNADLADGSGRRAVVTYIKDDGSTIHVPSNSSIPDMLTKGMTIRRWELERGDGTVNELTPGSDAEIRAYFGEGEEHIVLYYLAA